MTDHAQYAELLALYAVDALNPAEVPELKEHLRTCAECRSELAALRGDAALLALAAVGPAPPQRARQRFLAAISNEPRTQPERQRVVLGTFRPRWLSFAPVAAALLLAIFCLMLWRVNDRLQHRLEAAQGELQGTQGELKKVQQLVSLLNSPDSMHVTLVKMKTPPQPQIKAIYSPKMGRLLMLANNLEALPQNKVYELWLLPANGGAPVPAGIFKPDAQGNGIMEQPMAAGIEAKGFAITIEPDGGSTTPTLPIQMVGTG